MSTDTDSMSTTSRNATRAATTTPAASHNGPSTAITITGSTVTIPTSFLPGTSTGNPPPWSLLAIPSCTTPYPAVLKDQEGNRLVYFQRGCGPDHLNCCPGNLLQRVLLNSCPAGFVTQSLDDFRACCPPDFVLFPTGIGLVTPCYSNLSTPYVPAATKDTTDGRTASEAVFAISFLLVPEEDNPHPPIGAIVGGVFGGLFVLLALLTGIWWYWRRRQQSRTTAPEQPMGETWVTGVSPSSLSQGPVPPPKDSIVRGVESPAHVFSPMDPASNRPPYVLSPPGSPLEGTHGVMTPILMTLSPPAAKIVELEGDQNMDQNHPAYKAPPGYEASSPMSADSAGFRDSALMVPPLLVHSRVPGAAQAAGDGKR